MGVKKLVKHVLTEKENKRYQRALAERKVTYGEWLAEQEKLWLAENERIPDSAEEADHVLVCFGAGEMVSHARKSIACYFIEHPDAQVVYGDEDVRTPLGDLERPWFKPDWSPDLLDHSFYFGSLIAVRRELWDRMKSTYQKGHPGKWTEMFEEGDDLCRASSVAACEEWLHDCVRAGYEKGSRLVGHIPRILFHAQNEKVQESYLEPTDFREEKRRRRTEHFLQICGTLSGEEPLVSVVIPSKDQPEILRQCLESIRRDADLSCEILVVDNGSSRENREKVENLLGSIEEKTGDDVGIWTRYLYEPMDFNFSRMCNMGAKEARGKLFLFLNDDVELERGCIREMAALAVRPYTGAVGLKLLYPDTGQIQHDGIVNLPVGPVHKLQFHEDNRSYYYGRNRFDCNCVAVTGACLMICRDKFWEVGGFQESLKVAYNDVELGFRLWESGYQNVVVNSCSARHHESLSRGSDESFEKQKRLEQERELLYQMHPEFRDRDPYYPQGLNREGLDSRIVPAYVTCRNRPQKNSWRPTDYRLEELRRDECLMVRVETGGPEKIQGYSVVLGDNNACYEKVLLLLPEEPSHNIMSMKAEGQYRQDLEENLPDQENVALGGFCVSRAEENLQPGTYRIAMLAVNRVTGAKLWNESGKSMTVKA